MHANIQKIIPVIERISLAFLCVAFVFRLMGANSSSLLIVSLNGLSIAFFLYAFSIPKIPSGDENMLSFSDLFVTIILPKVWWISASVTTVGLMFFFVFPHQGNYLGMLMIGGMTMVVGSFSWIIFKLSGTRNIDNLIPVFYRIVPLLGMTAYIFLTKP